MNIRDESKLMDISKRTTVSKYACNVFVMRVVHEGEQLSLSLTHSHLAHARPEIKVFQI